MTAHDRIELRGLRVASRVGVLAHEQQVPQPLELDLDVHCDLATPGASADLADTVDYGALCALVEATATAGHVALLETLAEQVASAILAGDNRVRAVEVAVRKLRPPVPQQLATAGVRIVRRQEA